MLCDCQVRSIQLIDDDKVVELRCLPHGTNYLYFDDYRNLETQKSREARLIRSHICNQCKKPFSDFLQYAKSIRTLCDPCLNENNRIGADGRNRRARKRGKNVGCE